MGEFHFGWLEGQPPLVVTYDPWLLAVSVAIPVIASVAAMAAWTEGRRSARERTAWMLIAVSMFSFGVWAMHFTGMIAMILPVAISYDPLVTLASIIPAMAGLGLALRVLGQGAAREVLAAAAFMALGIGGMHYTGMSSIRGAVLVRYDPALFVLSLLVVFTVSLGALWVLVLNNRRRGDPGRHAKAALAGLAVPAMHYSGMLATRFYPSSGAIPIGPGVDHGPLALWVNSLLSVSILLLVAAVWVRSARRTARLESDRMAALLLAAPEGILTCDKHGTILTANRSAVDMFGVQDTELIGQKLSSFLGAPSTHGPRHALRPDGATLLVEVTTSRVADEWEDIQSIYLIRDVTERTQQDVRIRILAQAVEHAGSMVAILSEDGIVTWANREYQTAIAEPVGAVGITLTHPPPEGDGPWPSFQRNEPWTGRIDFRNGEGLMIETNARLTPIRADSGDLIAFVEVLVDLTEERQLQAQLVQSQKLESVGQLAAGVAHEINTPIQFVGDNLRFLSTGMEGISSLLTALDELLELVRDDPRTWQAVSRVEAIREEVDLDYLLSEMPLAMRQSLDGVDRVSTIVRAMKDYSHSTSEPVASDINQGIRNTVTVARNEWKYVAEVELDLDPNLPDVLCVQGEINQVVLNMLINSAHAIADGGTEGEKGHIRIGTRRDGKHVLIEVADNGGGMPKEMIDRVFDPFFTTKEVGRGTGQGLSIARQIVVNSHGGHIFVESELGVGTKFFVRLPVQGPKVVSAA